MDYPTDYDDPFHVITPVSAMLIAGVACVGVDVYCSNQISYGCCFITLMTGGSISEVVGSDNLGHTFFAHVDAVKLTARHSHIQKVLFW